ncbi:MAG TPA: hemolysin family protein [Cyclobacteriaceae bacterium]|nr:hemolysin family protein [Cyclobacteriaceae bacterium]HRK52332.1 hemolysin family protein [Cyclobacteriaceae bacterium]
MNTALFTPILISLIFSFFFSGIEIAFFSANKLQIELQGKQGVLWGRIMSKFVKKPSWFIGTTLIGNTLALVLFGILITQMIEPWLVSILPEAFKGDLYVLLVQTVISTLIILFTAEFLPKSLFLINPNLMLATLAIPFRIMFYILSPITFSIVYLSKLVIVHVLRLEYSEEKPAFGLTDMNHYLVNMQNVKHENEEIELDKKIFHNALEFKTVKVRECMIPRTEIIGIGSDEGLDKLKEAFIESGHSKIIIYKDTIDDVIGYCHSSALFTKPKTINEILTPINIVPEAMMVNELMIQFIKDRKSLAVVVDEFGGTSGIVSMEDIIEEIFGEIEDEHDEDDLVEQQLDEKTFLLSARLEIDYLNDIYEWNLPEGDYETLGGMILSYTEDFPEEGDAIPIPPYVFIIQSTEDNRIDIVKLIIEKNGAQP